MLESVVVGVRSGDILGLVLALERDSDDGKLVSSCTSL